MSQAYPSSNFDAEEFIGVQNLRASTAFVHESSYVDAPCQIGAYTNIYHFSRVMAHSIIGEHCHIGQNVTVSSGVMVGNDVQVMNNTLLNSGVILQDKVYCGPSTVFTEQKRVRKQDGYISQITPSLVKLGAHIGANTTIASGFTIGQYAFIEAGSVIDRNIPDFAVVYGNPIQFVGWQCQCGQSIKSKVDQQFIDCPSCGKVYQQLDEWKIVPLTASESKPDESGNSNTPGNDHPYFGFNPAV